MAQPNRVSRTWKEWHNEPPPPDPSPTPRKPRPPSDPNAPAPPRKSRPPSDPKAPVPDPSSKKSPAADPPPKSALKSPKPNATAASKKAEKKVAVARQTQHSKELINAFRPIKYFLTIIGQMPFVIKPKKDGTYSFKFYKFSGQVMVYFLMFFVSFGLFLLVTLGILSFIMDSLFTWIRPSYTVIVKDKNTGISETQKWERYLIRHEMVSIIVVWSWLTVACAGSLYIVTNSKYYVHYMNYFNRVVQIMDMDMTPGVGTYVFVNNMLSLVIAGMLILGFVVGYIVDFTAVTNTASVISNFIFRLFNVEIETMEENQFWFQLLGFFVMVYALFASRANIIQFLFFSQLLKNGSKIWNERLRKVLTHEGAEDEDDQFGRRLEPRLVYKDHLMIVQLYQMTENVFGFVLFTYYGLTIISVVMELYQLASLQGFGNDIVQQKGQTNGNDPKQKLIQDRMSVEAEEDKTHEHEVLATVGVALLLLMQNVIFCYRTTKDAAKAYETAMKGYDILRRHGLMYCRNKTDRNFVLSLYFSFAKNNPLQLTAGGYFAVNKVLLVTMASTIVNWAISIYQTKVDQWK